MHVAPPRHRQKAHTVESGQRADGHVERLGSVGERRPPHENGDRSSAAQLGAYRGHRGIVETGHRTVGQQRADQRALLTGAIAQRRVGVRREAGGRRRDLDETGLTSLGRIADTQVQDRQLFFEVGPEQHDRLRRAGLVDGGAREAEQHRRVNAVGQLSVDMVGADDRLGQLGPRVGVLVRTSGSAEHGDAARAVIGQRVFDGARRGRECSRPGGLDQLVALAHQRRGNAIGAVDGLETEAALVAEPTPVHGVGIEALITDKLVAARLHRHPAADRACRAGALALLEVPRTRLEPVGGRGERTHRADLHGVPREVRRERGVGEREHLQLAPAVGELDQRITGYLVGKARAAIAQDAALAVEEHE